MSRRLPSTTTHRSEVSSCDDDEWFATEEPVGGNRLGDREGVEAQLEVNSEILLVLALHVRGQSWVLRVQQ